MLSVLGIEFVVAIFIGAAGSFAAVRRYLKIWSALRMKKPLRQSKFLPLFILPFLFGLIYLNHPILADINSQQVQEKQSEIDALQKQIDDAKGQEQTLKSQLELYR